jgi:hypothetical protein
MKRLMTIVATVALAARANAGLPAPAAPTPAKANIPSAGQTLAHGWYGPGWDGGVGYFNPKWTSQYNPYPYYNIVGGESYGLLYVDGLPDQFESPFNPAMALTEHGVRLSRQYLKPAVLTLRKAPAPAAPPPNPAPN